MKIAHVVDTMEVGGAETLVSQLCRLQREGGHEPRVYAIGALGVLGKRLRDEGFIVESGLGKGLSNSVRIFYRLFRDFRPDAVHVHNPTPTVYAAMPAKLAGVRTVVSTRHSLVASPHKHVGELKYGVASMCCDWVVGICDATVANLKNLRTVPNRKIIRIYNGVVPVQPTGKGDQLVKSGFTLLYVGRLARVKNLSFLLTAFKDALAARRDLRLWIVGNGSERGSLEYQARQLGILGQVVFWGEQLEPARFFSAADCFVMSSISEGLPMSLLQAFSAGLPAIVTDVGGMAEVVRFARAGVAVPVANPGQMAKAILDVAGSEKLRSEMSQSARSSFQSSFELSIVADAYSRLYCRM